jgi:hypothetical protein
MTDLDKIIRDLADRGSLAAGAADPAEIREAGDSRRRNRIAFAVVTMIAVVAAVAAATGAVIYGTPSQQIPVSPAENATTVAPTPSPTPERHGLAEDPLPEGPFAWPDTYQGLERTGRDGEFRDFCLPGLKSLGATRTRTGEYFEESEASVNAGALEFEAVGAAEAAVAELRSLPDSCYASTFDRDTTVSEPQETSAGDEAFVFAYETMPNENNAGSEPGYFGYGVTREANIVVILEFGAFGPPVTDKPYATWTADDLNDFLDQAIG